MNWIENGLILAGVGFLIGSCLPVRWLIVHLPDGKSRRNWAILAALILLFIAGYIGYAVTHWQTEGQLSDLIVPVIFFFGAIFVYLVNSLSRQTAVDILRIAVLEQENVTDPLMVIYNRRYLERRLRDEILRTRISKQPLFVLLLDIDSFK